MKNLNNITYVAIDGRPNYDLTDLIQFAEYAQKHFNFYRCLILTPTPEKYSHNKIKFKKINQLTTVNQYSRFCVKDLNNFIESDFCLLYQNDGAISQPHLWDDNFLNFDYIGAPWPGPETKAWTGGTCTVGNGGFSLRSKKFLSVSSQIPQNCNINEDVFLTIQNKNFMDANNIKIADCSIGRKFAIEIQIDKDHKFETSFGFHGKRYEMLNKFKVKIKSKDSQ